MPDHFRALGGGLEIRFAARMDITPAAARDLEDCQAIYAHHVLHGTGSFEEIPPSLETLAARWRGLSEAGFPWLVARDASGVLGYAYYGPYHARIGWRFTVEDSIYVREGLRGRGVGKALLARLIALGTEAGYTQMLAIVGDSANAGSIGVHASLGFERAGLLREVGFKFGRRLDVVLMQRGLVSGN